MQSTSLKCVSIVEAAEALGVSRTKVFALVGAKQLCAIKIGRRTLVPLSSLQQFIDDAVDKARRRP
jgi:excisionase family DNA binding protein